MAARAREGKGMRCRKLKKSFALGAGDATPGIVS